MKCPSCGSTVPPTANWCPQCGYGSSGAPTRTAPTIALVGVLIFALFLAIVFIVGKTSDGRPTEEASKSATPALAVGQRVGTEGPFEVFVSDRESPSIRIGNVSEITILFVMENASGERFTMEVPPFSDEVMDVPVGRYRAEVSDPQGFVRSAQGTANLQSRREYRADFTVGYGGSGRFHIGD